MGQGREPNPSRQKKTIILPETNWEPLPSIERRASARVTSWRRRRNGQLSAPRHYRQIQTTVIVQNNICDVLRRTASWDRCFESHLGWEYATESSPRLCCSVQIQTLRHADHPTKTPHQTAINIIINPKPHFSPCFSQISGLGRLRSTASYRKINKSIN
jgi:hypothetical protein